MRLLAFTVLSMSLVACATQSSDVAEEATVEKTVAEGGDPDEMICRDKIQTGTRFTREECRTRADWEERAKAGGDLLAPVTRKSLQQNPSSGA